MKLSVKGFAAAFGILWASAVLWVGACNLAWPPYGAGFLSWVGSFYPGAGPGLGRTLLGTLWALADGSIAGAIFAWIYNRIGG